MVEMDLFTGQQWRSRHRLVGMERREERVRCVERVTCKLT